MILIDLLDFRILLNIIGMAANKVKASYPAGETRNVMYDMIHMLLLCRAL